MPKKPAGYERFDPKPGPNRTDRTWASDPEGEFYLFARQYHIAARRLVSELGPMQDSLEARACIAPVVLVYRKAMEQYLKAVILGEGSNFVRSRVHPLTVFHSHSLRWLSQLVRQIVRTVHLEKWFVCDGVTNLRDFKRIIDELDEMADGFYPDRYPDLLAFSWQLDAMLKLLDATADGLAQKWELWARAAAKRLADGDDASEPSS
jgi:hypothetical protein